MAQNICELALNTPHGARTTLSAPCGEFLDGHGSKIANAHYLQVTETDWQSAAAFTDQIGGDTGGDISAPNTSSPTLAAGKMTADEGTCELVTSVQVPPPRFERGFPDGESDVLGR